MSSTMAAMMQMATVINQAMRESSTDISLPVAMMGALPPELALAYVTELSADVRGAVMLDAHGNRLAGPAALAEPARALAGAHGLHTQDGHTVMVATADGRTLIAVLGPRAVAAPTQLDVQSALGATPSLPLNALPSALSSACRTVIAAT
jgi:hypothetical protein